MFMAESGGGFEELKELTENAPAVSKQMRKSPTLWKLAGYASIPVSAALGFGIVPSRRIAAHAVGAVVAGVAGGIGKSKLDSLAETAAKPALAQVLLDHGIDSPKETNHHVNEVKNVYGVLDEDFEAMCTDIYNAYLQGMVKHNLHPKTSELKELEQLKSCLGMDNLAVGEAHAAAAAEWYRSTCLFTPKEDLDDPDHPDRLSMDKLLFLTERALRQGGETEEAFLYEMTRVAKALDLTVNQALDRVADVAEPFYSRALKSTRSKLGSGQVSSDMLSRARKTLGISDDTATDMHMTAFNEEVRALLGKAIDSGDDDDDAEEAPEADPLTLKFADGAMVKLNELQEVLGLTDTDSAYEITVEATPLFQATALAAMQNVLAGTATADSAWEELTARREELLLKEESSKDLVSSMVMQALGKPLEETNKFAKVNNEAATYDHLLEALEAKEALIAVLAKSGWAESDKFDETFCNPRDKDSACGFMTSDERIKLYKIFMTRTVRKSEDGKLSEEAYGKVMEVKGLLGITDTEAEFQARGAFGPELQKALQTATSEILADFTPELVVNMKKNIDEVMSSYRLTEDFLKESGAGLYTQAVASVQQKTPGGIPTETDMEALDALRELFTMTKEDTYPAHSEYFGSVYKKSLKEAMGSTGVIRPDFRGALDDLKERLGVSEDITMDLFLEAVKEKMVPKVEWIVSEFERTQLTQKQLSERRGKDMGEDLFQTGKGADGVLGLGADINIMSDIMDLVDFYTENDITQQKEIGTKEVEKKIPAEEEGGEEQIVMEEVPVYETTYPITALEADCVEPEIAEMLYRQFIVGIFQTQGPNASRYEGAKGTFGGILGLTSEKMEEIGGTIGNTVYENFVANSMKTKGTLDQQDMMFLANMQGKLGLSAEKSEEMLLAAQKKVLSEEIDSVMDNPSPESVKAFREKCNGMGMDLVNDVGISKSRLIKMFEAEIIPGLKSGALTVESGDLLTETQESLGLEADEAEKVFESIITRLAKQSYELVQGELMRGREENCVEPITEIVQYAQFTSGELDLIVPEEVAYQIYNIYEAFDFSGIEEDAVEANKELLKSTLGLP